MCLELLLPIRLENLALVDGTFYDRKRSERDGFSGECKATKLKSELNISLGLEARNSAELAWMIYFSHRTIAGVDMAPN